MASYNYAALRVLIVEDESYTRQLIRQLLYQLGVKTIVEATNGRDGLLEIVRTRPDVVLCDVHMKPINGLEMLKQLRIVKLPGIAATPVIMLTADASKDTVMFAREHQVNGYLVKPVALNQLKGRIDNVIAASPDLGPRLMSGR